MSPGHSEYPGSTKRLIGDGYAAALVTLKDRSQESQLSLNSILVDWIYVSNQLITKTTHGMA